MDAARVAAELEAARARTLGLLSPLDDELLVVQHSPLMSPLVWDLAHVGNYEDLWLLRAQGEEGVGAHLDHLYDAFRHPRPSRPRLPLLPPPEARAYIAEVRARVLDRLDTLPPAGDDFLYGMVVQHEHQHDETMLATLQLMDGDPCLRGEPPPAPVIDVGSVPSEVLVEGGTCSIGTTDHPWAYDNERPRVEVDVPAFFLDTFPVTNGAFAAFVADGGYHDRRWWSGEGWEWRRKANLEHPEFWRPDGDGWCRRRFGRWERLPLDQPVQHVCWFEAEAFARWRGRRLPTETEWEKAAAWDAVAARARRWPWGDDDPVAGDGRANLGPRHLQPAPVGAYPAGAAPCGAQQMIGDVWEWTSSDFGGRPGFRSHPYREYSEVFFGPDYKVLKGGSWATDPAAMRCTFRNWDLPIRRQIFAGFRTARDP